MKVMSLADAVSLHVRDGDTVFVGGFAHCIPYAAAHAIIRQGKRDLTICRSGGDLVVDLLIASGAARKVIIGYLGNPGIGLAHAFRRAAETAAIEIEDWTNFAICLRLHAGALGLPFIPAATLLAGDMPTKQAIDVRTVECPFTGETLAAIPALNPDVALVHAQRADTSGNIQMWGILGDTVDGAKASRRVIATVEQVVPDGVIKANPNWTILPAYRVDAVCVVPFGAYPSYVHSFYDRADAFFVEYDSFARSAEKLESYISDWIRAPADWSAFLRKVGRERLDELKARAIAPGLATLSEA